MYKKLITICVALIVFWGCSKKTASLAYTTTVISLENKSTNKGTSEVSIEETKMVFLQSTGTGKTEYEATFNSEKNAFSALLFKGITGAQTVSPLVPDGQTSRANHKNFYKNFFNNRGYDDFILSTDKIIQKNEEDNAIVILKMKVNIKTLRKHLERNKIIRAFGW